MLRLALLVGAALPAGSDTLFDVSANGTLERFPDLTTLNLTVPSDGATHIAATLSDGQVLQVKVPSRLRRPNEDGELEWTDMKPGMTFEHELLTGDCELFCRPEGQADDPTSVYTASKGDRAFDMCCEAYFGPKGTCNLTTRHALPSPGATCPRGVTCPETLPGQVLPTAAVTELFNVSQWACWEAVGRPIRWGGIEELDGIWASNPWPTTPWPGKNCTANGEECNSSCAKSSAVNMSLFGSLSYLDFKKTSQFTACQAATGGSEGFCERWVKECEDECEFEETAERPGCMRECVDGERTGCAEGCKEPVERCRKEEEKWLSDRKSTCWTEDVHDPTEPEGSKGGWYKKMTCQPPRPRPEIKAISSGKPTPTCHNETCYSPWTRAMRFAPRAEATNYTLIFRAHEEINLDLDEFKSWKDKGWTFPYGHHTNVGARHAGQGIEVAVVPLRAGQSLSQPGVRYAPAASFKHYRAPGGKPCDWGAKHTRCTHMVQPNETVAASAAHAFIVELQNAPNTTMRVTVPAGEGFMYFVKYEFRLERHRENHLGTIKLGMWDEERVGSEGHYVQLQDGTPVWPVEKPGRSKEPCSNGTCPLGRCGMGGCMYRYEVCADLDHACVQPSERIWPIPKVGHGVDMCCHVNGRCAGNTDADKDAACWPGTQPKLDRCIATHPAWFTGFPSPHHAVNNGTKIGPLWNLQMNVQFEPLEPAADLKAVALCNAVTLTGDPLTFAQQCAAVKVDDKSLCLHLYGAQWLQNGKFGQAGRLDGKIVPGISDLDYCCEDDSIGSVPGYPRMNEVDTTTGQPLLMGQSTNILNYAGTLRAVPGGDRQGAKPYKVGMLMLKWSDDKSALATKEAIRSQYFGATGEAYMAGASYGKFQMEPVFYGDNNGWINISTPEVQLGTWDDERVGCWQKKPLEICVAKHVFKCLAQNAECDTGPDTGTAAFKRAGGDVTECPSEDSPCRAGNQSAKVTCLVAGAPVNSDNTKEYGGNYVKPSDPGHWFTSFYKNKNYNEGLLDSSKDPAVLSACQYDPTAAANQRCVAKDTAVCEAVDTKVSRYNRAGSVDTDIGDPKTTCQSAVARGCVYKQQTFPDMHDYKAVNLTEHECYRDAKHDTNAFGTLHRVFNFHMRNKFTECNDGENHGPTLDGYDNYRRLCFFSYIQAPMVPSCLFRVSDDPGFDPNEGQMSCLPKNASKAKDVAKRRGKTWPADCGFDNHLKELCDPDVDCSFDKKTKEPILTCNLTVCNFRSSAPYVNAGMHEPETATRFKGRNDWARSWQAWSIPSNWFGPGGAITEPWADWRKKVEARRGACEALDRDGDGRVRGIFTTTRCTVLAPQFGPNEVLEPPMGSKTPANNLIIPDFDATEIDAVAIMANTHQCGQRGMAGAIEVTINGKQFQYSSVTMGHTRESGVGPWANGSRTFVHEMIHVRTDAISTDA